MVKSATIVSPNTKNVKSAENTTKTEMNALTLAKSLQLCLTVDEDSDFWGKAYTTPNGPYYFCDNGADVLGVAHLDAVGFSRIKQTNTRIQCMQLDDRLGVWCLLWALPKLGVNIDILLTTGEEKGRSTGEHFEPPKQYNWIVEFDRRGTDVVFYDYDRNEQWVDSWYYGGWNVGVGTFSDIAFMEHLECCGANIGIGYHREHSSKCHVDLKHTSKQLQKFKQFWTSYKDSQFPYTEKHYGHHTNKAEFIDAWDDVYDDDFYKYRRYTE